MTKNKETRIIQDGDYLLNVERDPVDTRDYIYSTEVITNTEPPATLDYRYCLQDIRNQGNQGSCAAQAAACIKEWHEIMEIGLNEHMSPQFVYNARANYPRPGMTSRDVMKILHKIGIVRETYYPYGKQESFDDIDPEIKKRAENYRIDSYWRVNTIGELKSALHQNGCCFIAFPVYNYTMKFWKPRTSEETIKGGHAVTVVGYTKDAFILRNSWGNSWGDKGYTYFPFVDFGLQWDIWTTKDAHSVKPSDADRIICRCIIL